MKKTYQVPATVLVSVQPMEMIAQSVQGLGVNVTNEVGATDVQLSRHSSIWDDEEEE